MSAPNAAGILRDLIRRKGKISFARFMENALYHPEAGYYSRKSAQDDYYTNVDVHACFGEFLARYFCETLRRDFKGSPRFEIVELAAGSGKLAGVILSWIARNAPDCLAKLLYTAVERSPARRSALANIARLYPGRFDIRETFAFQENSLLGIVFSNEFFDALPFHRVERKDGVLGEIYVSDDFKEVAAPPSKEVVDYFSWLGCGPAEGTQAEAQLEARAIFARVAASLRKGKILTIDYGLRAAELYSGERPQGTALCHYRHKAHGNFYENIGEQDITAHVNFSALVKAGEECGLKTTALQTQSQFLVENGLAAMAESVQAAPDPRSRLKASSAVKTLVHPEGLGGTFKWLLQEK